LPTATSDRIPTLEHYFERYPDVPREVILKSDMLTLGHWFSPSAMAAATGALVKSYRLFSYDLTPMKDMKQREHRRVPEYFVIHGGPYELTPVMVQTTLSSNSPYMIDVVGGRLALTSGGRVLCDVRFPRPPAYYSRSLPDGTPFHEICAFGFFITVFRYCQFWGQKEECGFCDINANARQMKVSDDFTLRAPIKAVSDVATVVDAVGREARETGPSGLALEVELSGGTITTTLHGKTETEFYGEYAHALKQLDAPTFVRLNINARPKQELEWYRSMGVGGVNTNLEVWDKRLFEWINPGKAKRVGRDNWVAWICDAAEVFGPANVSPGFVCGIEMAKPYGFETVDEAVASTTEGIDFLLSHGIEPRFNHWRREPGTWLCANHDQPEVPLDFFIKLMRNRYELVRKHRARISPRVGYEELLPERNLFYAGHGTYNDYTRLMDGTTPPGILDQLRDRWMPFEDLTHQQ
jgi:hypothetical protein